MSSFFGREQLKNSPLPATDKPDPPEPKQPKLSAARQTAVDKLIASGRCKSVAHALFLARAEIIKLPL